MTILFSDDFESGGLTNWTGTNGTISATAGSARNGSFGCDANSNDAFAYKDFTAPASKFVSHRADTRLVTASGTGTFRVLQTSQGGTSVAKIQYVNGAYQLELRNRDNSLQTASITGIAADTWQQLRIDYDWTTANNYVATAYVDGTQVAQLTDTTDVGALGGWAVSRAFVLSFEDVASTSARVYFDGVVVEDTTPASSTQPPRSMHTYRLRRV